MLHATLLATVLALQGQSQFPTKHVTPKPEPGKVIAKVNGQDITAAELEGYLWDWTAKAALEDLIVYKLVVIEADRLAIKLDAEAGERPKKIHLPVGGYTEITRI